MISLILLSSLDGRKPIMDITKSFMSLMHSRPTSNDHDSIVMITRIVTKCVLKLFKTTKFYYFLFYSFIKNMILSLVQFNLIADFAFKR